MKISPERIQELERITPSTKEVQQMARDYMAAASLSPITFSHLLNYGETALRRFLEGNYSQVAATDINIRRAIVECIKTYPVTISTKAAGKLYETANVKVMREWFHRVLDRQGTGFVYGPPGSQKTFTAQHLVAEHNRIQLSKNGRGSRAFYVYCSQNITPADMLAKIAQAAGIQSTARAQATFGYLRRHLAARKVLFVLDEAQHLTIVSLEIVRELNDCEPHAAILLVGSHGLWKMFNERAAELEQWNSRMLGGIALPGIERDEAAQIIAAELGEQSPNKVKGLIERSVVPDIYAGRGRTYQSARRLFQQIQGVQSDPRFKKEVSA